VSCGVAIATHRLLSKVEKSKGNFKAHRVFTKYGHLYLLSYSQTLSRSSSLEIKRWTFFVKNFSVPLDYSALSKTLLSGKTRSLLARHSIMRPLF